MMEMLMQAIATFVSSIFLLAPVQTNQSPYISVAFSGSTSPVQNLRDSFRLDVVPIPLNFSDKLPEATGSAPLRVSFRGFIPDADLKSKLAIIDFGDGVRERVQFQPLTYTRSAPSPAAEFYQNVHTYIQAGAFIAELYLVSDCSRLTTAPVRRCNPAFERPLDKLGTARITVVTD